MSTLTPHHLYAGTPSTSRGEPTHISMDPTGATDNLVYPSGRVAVIRSISHPLSAQVFTSHTAPVTCVAFSRDASLVASGDAHGVIRLWNPKTALQFKSEIDAMAGPVRDLAFDDNGKFLLCVGESRGAFAKVVKIPGGSSAGVCLGHTKRALACDIGGGVLATVGEDMSVGVFKGPPVREIDSPSFLRHHTAFTNDVRFSPTGEFFAVASSDRKVSIVDAKSLKVVVVLEGHSASVTGLAWAQEGHKLLTSANDKTTKMWAVPSGECLSTITYGKDIMDMQVGCAVSKMGGEVVSASLKSEIVVCDEGAEAPKMVLRGHAKQIVGVAIVGSRMYSADYSGLLVAWDEGVGPAQVHFNGKGPTSVCAVDANEDIVATVGMDGKIFVIATTNLTFKKPVAVKGGGVDIAVPKNGSAQFAAIMVNETRLTAVDAAGESVIAEMRFDKGQTGCSVAVSSDGSLIAVGIELAGDAGELQFYTVHGSSFAPAGKAMRMISPPNRLAFSPDDNLIAVGEKSRRVRLYDATSRITVTGGGLVHTARVDGIGFSPDGQMVVSGGMDGSIAVWPVDSEDEPVKVKMGHRGGVTGVGFTSACHIVTGGGDCCVRSWTL